MYNKIWDYLTRLTIIALSAGSAYSTIFSVRVVMLFIAFVLFELQNEFAKKIDKE